MALGACLDEGGGGGVWCPAAARCCCLKVSEKHVIRGGRRAGPAGSFFDRHNVLWIF